MPPVRISAAKFLAACTLTAAAVAMTGCQDVITYADKTRDAGMVAYNRGDYPKAAGAFRSALRQDPRDYRSHYYLGMSALEMQNYQQATVAFRACLDTQNVTLLGREDEETRNKALDGLAQAIVKSDDADLEVNKVEQAGRDAKGAAAAREYFVLAKVYRYRKLPDMALDYYNRAILEAPKNFAFAKEFGLYCEQLEQTAKAREVLRQAYGINQRDPEVVAALQRIGTVPGPSLRSKADLAQPPLPRGPLPEFDKVVETLSGNGNNASEATPAGNRTAPAPQQRPTSIIPRD